LAIAWVVSKQPHEESIMSTLVDDILRWREKLQNFADDYEAWPQRPVLDALWDKAIEIGKSSSKSWMGYHANVYYANFAPPPAGDHFDIQNGTAGTYFSGPDPNWIERTNDEVWAAIVDPSGEVALAEAADWEERGRELLQSAKADAASILSIHLSQHDDPFVRRIADDIDKMKVLDAAEIANERSPKGRVMTQDLTAAQQGTWVPPHMKVEVRIVAAHQPAAHARELVKSLDKLASHIARTEKRRERDARVGTNVFIGHGRSSVWRDLKDFVKERLRLPHDEFNRVPVAGITNIARLSEMLDSAACAFIIMTAEDELADGKIQARMNVIHEVGLFQGRLGFTKAIVLLEEGCEEFSNIQGLGQIRFPKGNISAKFEDIRQVLEREGVIEAQDA
jgi:predicted nucleotide-binding protein